MNTVASLRTQGITAREACDALGVSAATFYRRHQPQPLRVARPRPSPPRALPAAEREHVLEVLHSERFVDSSPAQVSATLGVVSTLPVMRPPWLLASSPWDQPPPSNCRSTRNFRPRLVLRTHAYNLIQPHTKIFCINLYRLL